MIKKIKLERMKEEKNENLPFTRSVEVLGHCENFWPWFLEIKGIRIELMMETIFYY